MTALSQDVADVMTVPVVTVLPESTVMDALRLLLEQGIKRLPVTDAQGRLLGFVGRARLLHALYAIPATTTPTVIEGDT